MSIDILRTLNPGRKIINLSKKAFSEYGEILDYDATAAIEKYDVLFSKPVSGGKYIASVPELEALPIIQEISKKQYAGLPTQAGICIGFCSDADAMEYHQCGEVLIVVRDCIMALGKRWDIEQNSYDMNKSELFYVERGTVIELYATTLHYMPIHVDDYLSTICILLKGTNAGLEQPFGRVQAVNKFLFSRKGEDGGELLQPFSINRN